MKRIIKRTTGETLSLEEARSICYQTKTRLGATYVEDKSVCGYPTAELSKRANLRAVCETYEGYTFAYTGTVYDVFEGYKVVVLAIKDLPVRDFEQQFPKYVVLG